MALEKLLNYVSQGLTEEDFEKKIQEKYASCVKNKKFDDMEVLMDITKIEPKLSEESIKTVQEAYIRYLKEGEISSIQWVYRITRIRPKLPEDFVQKKYKALVKHGWLYSLKSLYEVSGIEPSEEVCKEFLKYLSNK